MMKKLFFIPLSIILLTGAFSAQSQQVETKTQQDAVVKNEHLVMKDGKMFHNMDGKETQMQNQMTLKNGVMIDPDGGYKLKNGKQQSLRNGQCMDMNGRKYRSQQMFQKSMMGNHGMGNHGQNMHPNGSHHNISGAGMHKH